ncbi:hypothetical protein ABW20_dc0100121 [Dactylellina cionopaga]|nr:hypothetical protein ABW20_dc0100121 [Dactylellina cionopaga]
MVWDQSASDPIYSNPNVSMYPHLSDISGPPTPEGLESPPFELYGGQLAAQYHPMPPYGYTESLDSHLESSLSPEQLFHMNHNGYWSSQAGLDDNMSRLDLGSSRISSRPSSSSLHTRDSASDLALLNSGGIGAQYHTRHYADIDEGYAPASPEESDELPPYAELIYQALKSAPGYQMHLQDIYQWFRDNYAKFRNEKGKGWMNSIRHNLSMNGAFVKVERPQNEPGKGYMWLLAPAAVEGGIKSTTRYRKCGNALSRSNEIMTPDKSYSCYVTPKRNRTGKKYQTKARRTAKKNLHRMQHVDQQQQQPHEFPEFGTVHTPIDMPSMTPDFSPYHSSEGFSETLSTSSRHATPLMSMRNTEWQSPTSAHRQPSPYYSDDGFNSSYDNSVSHGYHGYSYECKFNEHE